jgi:cytochrome c oxidase subunit 4
VSDSQPHIGLGSYFAVFFALMVLTAVTIWVAFMDFGFLNNVIAVGIAVIKGSLVILYFMHVRHSSKLTKALLPLSIAFFIVLVAFVFADVWTRGMLEIFGRPPVIGG